uniref:AAA_12 domain-containing protein n=1 Tax=Anopheles minimus TaxID=112268 RepID=A0A182WHM8_9DIPT
YGISKLLLVGDVHQLPATVLDQQSVESGFRKSHFSRIYQSYIDNKQREKLKVLTTQYRMHPEISYWPNKYFYQRQLKNYPCTEVHRKEIPLKHYMVISLSYDQELTQAQFEIYNKDEIQFVVGLIKQMLNCFDKHASFAIITPYTQHTEELAKTLRTDKLERVAVHSIDSVQGKEFDVVVISLARSNGAGFLDQPERINVALTRAKQCLVLCENFISSKRKPVWSSLLADAQQRTVYYELDDHDPQSHKQMRFIVVNNDSNTTIQLVSAQRFSQLFLVSGVWCYDGKGRMLIEAIYHQFY